MGLESETTVRIDKTEARCRVLLEPGEIIVRGALKRRLPHDKLADLSVESGWLTFNLNSERVAIDLGNAADSWLSRIQNPRTRSQKLGLKPGMAVCLIGEAEPDVAGEVESATGQAPGRRMAKNCDLVLFVVETPSQLERLAAIEANLAPKGAVWVLYPKGRKEITHEIIVEQATSAGLVQTKSMAFSDRLSGLRLTRPARRR